MGRLLLHCVHSRSKKMAGYPLNHPGSHWPRRILPLRTGAKQVSLPEGLTSSKQLGRCLLLKWGLGWNLCPCMRVTRGRLSAPGLWLLPRLQMTLLAWSKLRRTSSYSVMLRGGKAHRASEPFFLLWCCHGNVVISANRGGVSGERGHVLIGAMRGCGLITLRNREAETEK